MSTAAAHVIPKRPYALAIAGLVLTGLLFGGLYILDQYLHRKLDPISSVNKAGYRGTLLGPKQPHERRIFLMGSSTAFGYGVNQDQTIAAHLEQLLNAKPGLNVRFSVANLGFNNTGASALEKDLLYYSYLEPDVVIFYTGSSDLGLNLFQGRHESTLFRLTGYYSVLAPALTERAKFLRYYSWGRWSNRKRVFRPGQKVETQKQSNSTVRDWSFYCGLVKNAVQLALSKNLEVLVVTEPYVDAEHMDQQKALREMIAREFGNQPLVTYVDLGSVVDPTRSDVGNDGFHLNTMGNRVIAEKLAKVVLSME